MRPRIRIIYPDRTVSFSERLEQRARSIIERQDGEAAASGSVAGIRRELALTLDQLDRFRQLHEGLRRRLLRLECYTDNELNAMEMRTPKYSPYRFPEREKLQRRLIKIEDERRRLAIGAEDRLQDFQSRLLSLVEQHVQLAPHNGNKIDRQET